MVKISDISSLEVLLNLHVMVLSSVKRVNLNKSEQFEKSFIKMRDERGVLFVTISIISYIVGYILLLCIITYYYYYIVLLVTY